MSSTWELDFRKRMDLFRQHQSSIDGIPVSIKVQVTGGCFHREHSPQAYNLIDAHLRKIDPKEGISLEEHESGPEVLIYLAYATVVLGLAKSVVDLVTAIIKSRSDGIKKGDRPSEPLELIVRTVDQNETFVEEQALHILHEHPPDSQMVAQVLNLAINKLLSEPTPNKGARRKTTTLTNSKRRAQSKRGKNKKSSLKARRRRK